MDTPPANDWLSWRYLSTNWDEVSQQFGVHASLTLQAVAIATAIALPLALAVHRVPRLSAAVVSTGAVLYTVPSLALFALLAPFTGIGRTTVVIGLVVYALLVLLRTIIDGLRAVDPDVIDAARGQGYGSLRLALTVELPQALPSVVTALRLATVTTVALVTVGVVVGYGGLGQLMFRGFQSGYRAQITTSVVLTVLLALALDLAIMLLGRLATPWARGRRVRP